MWKITYEPLKTDKKFGTQKLGGTLLLSKFQENGKFWNFLGCRILWLKCQTLIMQNWKIARFFSMEILTAMQVLRLFCPAVYMEDMSLYRAHIDLQLGSTQTVPPEIDLIEQMKLSFQEFTPFLSCFW